MGKIVVTDIHKIFPVGSWWSLDLIIFINRDLLQTGGIAMWYCWVNNVAFLLFYYCIFIMQSCTILFILRMVSLLFFFIYVRFCTYAIRVYGKSKWFKEKKLKSSKWLNGWMYLIFNTLASVSVRILLLLLALKCQNIYELEAWRVKLKIKKLDINWIAF